MFQQQVHRGQGAEPGAGVEQGLTRARGGEVEARGQPVAEEVGENVLLLFYLIELDLIASKILAVLPNRISRLGGPNS